MHVFQPSRHIYFLIFFSTIKKITGQIATDVFMSDITNVYYNAWLSEMGIPQNRLYCSWHVDRAWKINIDKIKNSEKRDWIYKTEKYLQTTVDRTTFNKKMDSAIQLFMNDEDTKEFLIIIMKMHKCGPTVTEKDVQLTLICTQNRCIKQLNIFTWKVNLFNA